MSVTSTAAATTTSTGAMIGSGGMGVKQNLYIGGNMNVMTGDVTAANLGTTRNDLCLIGSPAGATFATTNGPLHTHRQWRHWPGHHDHDRSTDH